MVVTSSTMKKVLSVLIVFVPIFNCYALGQTSIGMGDILLGIIAVLSFFSGIGKKQKVDKQYFVLYFSLFFVLSLASILIRGQKDILDFILKWIRIVVIVYVADVAVKRNFDKYIVKKWLIRVGVILSLLLVLQVIASLLFSRQLLFHFRLSLFLPYGFRSVAEFIGSQRRLYSLGGWRPSAIFSEPAHFAQFVMLPLVAAIFGTEDLLHDKKNLGVSIIITVALFLSRSANGVLIVVAVWGIYIVKHFSGEMKARYFMVMITFLLVGILFLSRTNFLNSALGRVETIHSSGGTTGTIRLLQGMAVFGQLPVFAKWFGLGYGNIQAFQIENNIRTSYITDIGNEYMNGFSTALVSGGVVGLLLYLYVWYRIFKENKSDESRMALLVLAVLFCTSAIFYSGLTVLYFVFIRCDKGDMYGHTKTRETNKRHAAHRTKYFQRI